MVTVGPKILIHWVKIPENLSSTEIQDRLDLLDAEECATYSRYKVDLKKIEFLVGRCLAKMALGQFLHVQSGNISFSKNEYGKLFLKNSPKPLYFNLSHTDEMVVCAFSANDEIGIDVEKTLADRFEVMKHVYVPEEIEWVNAQRDKKAKLHAFYKLWTRKEAVMKAVGKGFSLSPLSFTVPFDEEQAYDDEFYYYTFVPTTGYMITVATKLLSEQSPTYEMREVQLAELLAGRVEFTSLF
ncbi:4'-phosphopantetheinyl transferase superfamily protein [Brevibacillus sp. DP1.3A]|uniref:4'-phosphopantetheinyl transferase family protein n=1 Tax=Brevibacillus sp. DP1.3A TaxID=2738867 RepID=UPI00156B85E5|nr:4'-phosphopantetheinyl transferase superfamily protein [Brevibacillus sp. DP1.3A]UED72189.1 4'-phosphopantetheinyl transferase superfamily protein [Brevibacillus sp. DP1.3A]